VIELPRFRSPPVTEASLSIQFNTLPFNNALAGLFWGEVRDRYSTVVEQMPLPPAFETFGSDVSQSLSFPFPIWGPAASRFWYLTSDEVYVLQLQQDRLVRNWRKRADDHVYPGYFVIKKALEQDLAQLVDFADRENLGLLVPNQCEVSYTNVIIPPEETDPGKNMSRITSICPVNPQGPDGTTFEGSTTQARFLVNDVQGHPVGRIYASFAPQVASDGRLVVRVDLLIRGRPPEANLPEALEFLDFLHSAAVRSFVALTTAEMHQIWGLDREL